MRSATLDSNIFISALQFNGIGVRLLNMARRGELRVDTSDEILNETVGVLRDKYRWEGYRLSFARATLAKLANLVTPTTLVKVVSDPDDDRILECAIEAGSDCIITHDKHLRRLQSFKGIPILTPEEFLQRGIER